MQAMHAFLSTTRCSNISLSMDKYSQRILSIPTSGFFQAVKNDSRFITSILRYIEMKEIYQDYVPHICSQQILSTAQYSGFTVSKCEWHNLSRFSFIAMYLRILVMNRESFLTAWKNSELGVLRILLGYLSILMDTVGTPSSIEKRMHSLHY